MSSTKAKLKNETNPPEFAGHLELVARLLIHLGEPKIQKSTAPFILLTILFLFGVQLRPSSFAQVLILRVGLIYCIVRAPNGVILRWYD